MKTGQAVFQDYQGIRRFGVVTKTTIKEDRWCYAEVKWFNDHVYDRAMNDLAVLRSGKDFKVYEYRIDSLKQINPATEVATLNEIMAFQASGHTGMVL